jgi:hypothetical protein
MPDETPKNAQEGPEKEAEKGITPVTPEVAEFAPISEPDIKAAHKRWDNLVVKAVCPLCENEIRIHEKEFEVQRLPDFIEKNFDVEKYTRSVDAAALGLIKKTVDILFCPRCMGGGIARKMRIKEK